MMFVGGGPHEMSVSMPYVLHRGVMDREVDGVGSSSSSRSKVDLEVDDDEVMVDVRFSSDHDYDVVPDEDPVERQKVIPVWVRRFNCAFARFVLDMATKQVLQLYR
jgi:hypothetical protein